MSRFSRRRDEGRRRCMQLQPEQQTAASDLGDRVGMLGLQHRKILLHRTGELAHVLEEAGAMITSSTALPAAMASGFPP